MDQVVAKVYLNRGNSVDLEVRAGVPPRFPLVDLLGIDRITLDFSNEAHAVHVDSDDGEGMIDWSVPGRPGVLRLTLGALDIPSGAYNVTITAYDVEHPTGQVLLGAELPEELAFEFIAAP